MCDSWKNSSLQFRLDMGDRPEGTTIDRKDNNGDYSPDNCRWATRKEQDRNKRTNHLLTVNGVTKPLIDWSEETGINKNTLLYRLKYGWTPEEVVTRPIQVHRKENLS